MQFFHAYAIVFATKPHFYAICSHNELCTEVKFGESLCYDISRKKYFNQFCLQSRHLTDFLKME